jgi:uncharacterized protein (TIGR03066 family)
MLPGLGNRPGIDGARPGQLPANAGDRRNNLNDRLTSRDDIRGDRQDNRQDRHQDWQDRYGNIYNNHQDWHHGCWNGNGSGWWNHMWSDHTALMAFGTTMWGINRAAYAFGYWGYDNPYYSEPYPVTDSYAIDYSQPIAVDQAAAAAPPAEGAPVPGMADFNAARQSFFQGDYPAALASTNKALTAMPNDPIVHEFRALVLFAQGKYKESAAGLYSVLSVGPGWDWTTLSSLYPSVDTYTQQLRTLENYMQQNPQAADARFVLAYHYLTMGDKDAATSQLKVLYQKTPQDPLIKQLLLMTGGPEAIGASATAAAPAPSAAAVPAEALVGKWSAAGPANAKFNLELTKDGNFSWAYSQGGKSQTVKGVYALDGATLAMEPEGGGTMLADVTVPQNGSFSFAMLGAPPGDPGLKFAQVK